MTRPIYARHAVLPGPNGPEVHAARVVVEGARIVSVERTSPHVGDDDVGDRLLAPAFVDAHTHLALHAVRGLDVAAASAGNLVEDLFFRVERAMGPEDVGAFAAVGAVEALLSGTATVFDHYYAADRVLAACRSVGLAAVVAPAVQDLSGPGADGADEALALTERLARDPALAADGCGVVLGPHAPDTVSDARWRQIADLAERLGLPVHTHAAQSFDEVERLVARGGRTPVAHLHALGVLDAGPGWRLAHALFASDAEVAALPETTELVACPTSSGWFGFVPPVDRWTRLGRRWSVATDGSASGDALSVRAQLRLLPGLAVAGLASGPEGLAHAAEGSLTTAAALDAARRRSRTDALSDPGTLLDHATRIPGALHPRLAAGVIAPGALAHLALWDLDTSFAWPGDDPLRALALGGGPPAQLMVAGRWRGERGAFVASVLAEPSVREARAEATARRRALLARL